MPRGMLEGIYLTCNRPSKQTLEGLGISRRDEVADIREDRARNLAVGLEAGDRSVGT